LLRVTDGVDSVNFSLVIDCRDPEALARFWQSLVGGEIDSATKSSTWVSLKSLSSLGYLGFQRVPEPKQVKNRVHIDLIVDDLVSSRDSAVASGAIVVGGIVEEPIAHFQVMQDPEGNEFCFVRYTNGQ
jgi:predicted enzyme related to lactoylglutathione lyase